MSSGNPCLNIKRDKFQTDLTTTLKKLQEIEEFTDVTLSCENNQKIEVHKVIIAASSTFFHTMMKQIKHPNPIIYMRGLKQKYLVNIVDFIYNGDVTIEQEDLEEFLTIAEEFELTGFDTHRLLPKVDEHQKKQKRISHNQQHTDNRKDIKLEPHEIVKPTSNSLESLSTADHVVYEFQDLDNISTKENCFENVESIAEEKLSPTLEKLDETIQTMMERFEGSWKCIICEKTDKRRSIMARHMEAKHIEGVCHPCYYCEKSFRSRNSLAVHKISHKKNSGQLVKEISTEEGKFEQFLTQPSDEPEIEGLVPRDPRLTPSQPKSEERVRMT